MNDLNGLVYALKDYDLSDQKLNVLINKTGGRQGNFSSECPSTSGVKSEEIISLKKI